MNTLHLSDLNATISDYERLDNDINGNPRYYISCVSLFQFFPNIEDFHDIIKIINKNRKYLSLYRGKKYGYGYTITSYNLESDLTYEIIHNLLKHD